KNHSVTSQVLTRKSPAPFTEQKTANSVQYPAHRGTATLTLEAAAFLPCLLSDRSYILLVLPRHDARSNQLRRRSAVRPGTFSRRLFRPSTPLCRVQPV